MKQPCEALIRTGPPDAPCAEKSRPWLLVATILGSGMAFIDNTVVNVALPALQSNLHANVVDVQWVIEAYGLFLSALILVGGALGDSLGRRAMFLWGVVGFAFASVSTTTGSCQCPFRARSRVIGQSWRNWGRRSSRTPIWSNERTASVGTSPPN